FFQAEDGIRDRTVTGVQTCALPIFGERHACGQLLRGGVVLQRPVWRVVPHGRRRARSGEVAHEACRRRADLIAGLRQHAGEEMRSEERRVGKEWREGWGGERER